MRRAASPSRPPRQGTDWETATASVTYDCSEVGAQTIYLRATDSHGNATTSTASITITSAAPTISSVLSGQTEALGSDGTVVIDASAYVTATDDCSSAGNMTYEISETSGSGFATTFTADCADLGAKTFYFRVTDESSATSTESSQSITIADQTAPTHDRGKQHDLPGRCRRCHAGAGFFLDGVRQLHGSGAL